MISKFSYEAVSKLQMTIRGVETTQSMNSRMDHTGLVMAGGHLKVTKKTLGMIQSIVMTNESHNMKS
eukprot:10140444-Karenia_brevis.AAC.1